MSRVDALITLVDHLHDTGLLVEPDWLRLRAQALALASDLPQQSPSDMAEAWARGSLPHHEYRAATLELDLKDALRCPDGTALSDVTDTHVDLRARMAVYEAEQVDGLRSRMALQARGTGG